MLRSTGTTALEAGRPGAGKQRRYFDTIADVAGIHLRLGHLRAGKKPSWRYPLLAALTKLGSSEEQLAEHFTFRPQLEQKATR